MNLVHLLFVGAGGFVGAILRFAVSQFVNKRYAFQLPVATLIVNLAGSFLLGLIMGAEASEPIYLLLGVGLMGSLTTFSTFKLEGIQLHVNRKWKTFIAYNSLSYGGGIVLAFVGFMIGRL
ncbi:putative fluoride ion transporter CrcB 2 [Halobacillus andaensis]|uniref:Fluoride-specific ion channel FluC n=1 Tax=Halobacillus andaensis TaxID=1176239 RepID=A0A917EXB5_HALAA|nr:fluoride efflux transporter CrcB [Halobacillus andaensis]MBP2004802.1 CrcB protein [Halobacillus andaensis]GGF18774.1 putative fluoride ion transporter CrcB 2 [Halobacillus andaensis]